MKPIIIRQAYAFLMVYYPYRKSGDLYVMMKDQPVFCAQCEQTLETEETLAHIRQHDKRKGPATILSSAKDGKLYEVAKIVRIEED